MKIAINSFLSLVACLLFSCVENKDYTLLPGIDEVKPNPPTQEVIPNVYLKDVYKDYFPIGTCVYADQLSINTDSKLIKDHYNSITAENEMKFEALQPSENNFVWNKADQLVDFAMQNNMKVRGHTLIWHSQTPDWVFKDGTKSASKELLFARMEKHIKEVMTRYKGRVYCWDVVNEVISDKNSEYFRAESAWYKIAGEEFVAKAFEIAHATDPDALLFYNDYNLANPEKRDKVCRMIDNLKKKGIPVHGIGMQAHYNINYPSEKDFADAIDKYAALGCQVHITELDISVYNDDNQSEIEYSSDIEKKQRTQYGMLFKVLREKKEVVTSVSFWGISDKYSWLNNWPVANRKNYPLLFDRELSKKTPFIDVVKF